MLTSHIILLTVYLSRFNRMQFLSMSIQEIYRRLVQNFCPMGPPCSMKDTAAAYSLTLEPVDLLLQLLDRPLGELGARLGLGKN